MKDSKPMSVAGLIAALQVMERDFCPGRTACVEASGGIGASGVPIVNVIAGFDHDGGNVLLQTSRPLNRGRPRVCDLEAELRAARARIAELEAIEAVARELVIEWSNPVPCHAMKRALRERLTALIDAAARPEARE